MSIGFFQGLMDKTESGDFYQLHWGEAVVLRYVHFS